MNKNYRTPPAIALSEFSENRVSSILPFIAQPLMQPRNNELFAFEVLYRGSKTDHGWLHVDETMLTYLAENKINATLFVNLSNEAVLNIDSDLVHAAARNNKIYFEWSETVSTEEVFKKVVARINRWSQDGLKFAIDDFGCGRDGFERLFSIIDTVAAIKLDGNFFRMAMESTFARKLVSHIIFECESKGILTVGECVETHEEFRLAESLGLDLVQGYYVDALYQKALPDLLVKSAC